MAENRKEEIIIAAVDLAAKYGFNGVSMNMIADKVGVKKPSLYNHFKSKEKLIDEAYNFLRQQAIKASQTDLKDFDSFMEHKSAVEILQYIVSDYIKISNRKKVRTFYKIIYSERCFNKTAAKILSEETEKNIYKIKRLFYIMEAQKKMHFKNTDYSAKNFVLTVQGFIDYDKDIRMSKRRSSFSLMEELKKYILYFCEENKI